jgi:hypothetical protein
MPLRSPHAYCEPGVRRGCGLGGRLPPEGNWIYGETTIGTDDPGGSSVGVAIGWAFTMGCRESGAVCHMKPLWPSLTPCWESRITGLRGASSGEANAAGPAKGTVSEAAIAAVRADLSERTGGMGGPVEFEKPDYADNALPYLAVDRQASRYSP